MTAVERFVVVDRLGRYLRLYDGGGEAALFAIGWVKPDDWHAQFASELVAAELAERCNAQNRFTGASVERRRT